MNPKMLELFEISIFFITKHPPNAIALFNDP